MNTTKRLLCLLLVLVMLVCAFAGCTEKPNDNDPKDTDETTGNDDDTKGDDDESDGDDISDETTDPRKADTLLPSYSFGEGVQEFVILSRRSTTYEFEASSEGKLSGVEQAVYDRNSAVEERCNVDIVVSPLDGDWGHLESFTAALRENNNLPVSQYDLVGTHSAYLATAVLEGYSWDFNQLPNIDLTKIWWSEYYYNENNYNGAIYLMFGDLAHTLYEYLEVMFFNEQLAEDLGIDVEGLYNLALDGDWTLDKLITYSALVTPNEDAPDEDRKYGFMTNAHSHRSFLTSLGVDLAPFNAEGKHEFPKKLSAAQSEPLQAFANFVTANPNVRNRCGTDTGAGELDPIFSEGRALFYSQTLDSATYLKANMKQKYGVLPFPKYNDLQKNYVTGIRDTATGVMVPYHCKNDEMSGTVTEMLSMYGYTEVFDAYFEERVKYQSFDNPLCVQSLELIRTTFAPSFVMTFSHYMNFANSSFSGALGQSETNGVPLDMGTTISANLGTYRRLCRDLYLALDKIAEKRG